MRNITVQVTEKHISENKSRGILGILEKAILSQGLKRVVSEINGIAIYNKKIVIFKKYDGDLKEVIHDCLKDSSYLKNLKPFSFELIEIGDEFFQ